MLRDDLKPYFGHAAVSGVTARYVRFGQYRNKVLREKVTSKLEIPFEIFAQILCKKNNTTQN